MTVRSTAALLALGLLAAGCGSDRDNPAVTSVPGGASATAVAGEALATYRRSGGLAGRRFDVVVRPDGTFEGGTGKPGRGHLGTSALEELRGLVAGFVASRPEPTYGEATPDGFTTTVRAGNTTTSVLADAGAPQPVLRLVGFLAGLERQLPR